MIAVSPQSRAASLSFLACPPLSLQSFRYPFLTLGFFVSSSPGLPFPSQLRVLRVVPRLQSRSSAAAASPFSSRAPNRRPLPPMATISLRKVNARLPPEVNRALYIRNLSFNITSEEMYDIFGKYGAIWQICIGNSKDTRGTAFLEISTSGDEPRPRSSTISLSPFLALSNTSSRLLALRPLQPPLLLLLPRRRRRGLL